MGLADVINREDRIEITKSELFDFMLCKAENQLIVNGLINGVPRKHIIKMLDMEVNKIES